MTEAEQDLVILNVVKGLPAEKKRLACFEAKAIQIKESVDLVLEALKNNVDYERKGDTFHIYSSGDDYGTTPATWPTLQEIEDVLDGLKQTKKKVAELEQQRRDLGID